MPTETIRVKGYREFLRACDHVDKDVKRETHATFRKVGEVVRVEATQLFSRYDVHSAQGYKVKVRQRGIAVEQSLRKTTGKHPEYGALQMRKALLPALRRREAEVIRQFEDALDRVAYDFVQRSS